MTNTITDIVEKRKPNASAQDLMAQLIEVLGATLEQADLHTWKTLLIYAPRAALPAAPDREARQRTVVEWGRRCFGKAHMADRIIRAARFFEEAAELVQAVGLDRQHALRAFDHVYSRTPGNVFQEAGGVSVTLMALCDVLGLSADKCEADEIVRCLSKAPEYFAERNKNKIAVVDTPISQCPADRDAVIEECAKEISRIISMPSDCDFLEMIDPETGVAECGLETRGIDCTCAVEAAFAEKIRAAIRALKGK